MKKIPIAILGATGMVGQRLLVLLQHHPWFKITALCASPAKVGKKYGENTQWTQQCPIPKEWYDAKIQSCSSPLEGEPVIVFSGLDSSVAGEIEASFAKKGHYVVSNSKNHRMDPTVPLIIPEINADHLRLLDFQTQWGGKKSGRIITNPNCTTIGLSIALAPILRIAQIESIHVVSMQALSGAGLPGVPSINSLDNVIPNILDEANKIASEPHKILGTFKKNKIIDNKIKISAQTHRVSVSDGHLLHVIIKTATPLKKKQLIKSWVDFSREKSIEFKDFPMSPEQCIYYSDDAHYPQPRFHRDRDKGMSVCIGQLQECSLGDFSFNVLSHNTIRGAAGAAIFNGELLRRNKLI